jgi:glycosyltransferase involved in cell wall biosynthesis
LAFVFPSLYEGFGIPVLEAFSCKCPCLLSNHGSLPEVGGSAALYFDPVNTETLQTAFSCLLESPSLRKDLIEKGTERLKSFSWDKTYREVIQLYKSIL